MKNNEAERIHIKPVESVQSSNLPKNKKNKDTGKVYIFCTLILSVITLVILYLLVDMPKTYEIHSVSDGRDIYSKIVDDDAKRQKANDDFFVYRMLQKLFNNSYAYSRRPRSEDLDEQRPVAPKKSTVRPHTYEED